MLVRSRAMGEKILIDSLETEITIVAIQGKQVRIAIAAPQEVLVCRQENAQVPARIRKLVPPLP